MWFWDAVVATSGDGSWDLVDEREREGNLERLEGNGNRQGFFQGK